jgi:ATP-dependent Clp endopeptidase proteolytic subunit ClpP
MEIQNLFKVTDKGESARLDIYGIIGSLWDDLGADDVVQGILDCGEKNIELHVNSNGGSMSAGFAIYNSLANYKGKVTAIVDSMAASMASVIIMAADKVIMPQNSFLMIHNPWVYTEGDADQLRKQATNLDKFKDAAVLAYSKKTGLSKDKISELMNEESLLSAKECLELGFADELADAVEDPVLNQLNKFKGGNPVMTIEKSLVTTPGIDAEMLKTSHTDVFNSIVAEGVRKEQERVSSIVKAEIIPGYENIRMEMIADGKSTVNDLIQQVMALEVSARNEAQNAINNRAVVHVVTDTQTAVTQKANEDWKNEFDSEEDYKAFKDAEEKGLVRIKGGK